MATIQVRGTQRHPGQPTFAQVVRRIRWTTERSELVVGWVEGAVDQRLARERLGAYCARHGIGTVELQQSINYPRTAADHARLAQVARLIERLTAR